MVVVCFSGRCVFFLQIKIFVCDVKYLNTETPPALSTKKAFFIFSSSVPKLATNLIQLKYYENLKANARKQKAYKIDIKFIRVIGY